MLINFLIRRFINDHEHLEDEQVRGNYGIFASVLSIILNVVLVIFKILVGLAANSIAVIADGINNMTDVVSNLATLVGFRLALQLPDEKHPYGHGRFEYISGIIISFFILVVAFVTVRDSVVKIVTNEPVFFDTVGAIVLIGAIFVKFFMAYFNRDIGSKIESTSLLAAAQDSLNDVLATTATLIALVLSRFTTLPVDGIMGTVVGIIVFRSGIEIFKDTVNPLLGLAPSPDLVKEIVRYVNSHEVTKGTHDIMIHDYGPSRKFMTLHVEVDARDDIMAVHDAIDNLESDLEKKFKIKTVIHMDPIDYNNPELDPVRKQVVDVIKMYDDGYSIHDFRMVDGPTHTNLIFDLVVPFEQDKNRETIKEELTDLIEIANPKYRVKMTVEHKYY